MASAIVAVDDATILSLIDFYHFIRIFCTIFSSFC